MTSNGTRFQSRRLRPLGLLVFAAAALSGCLNRPVAKTKPQTNNVFVKQNPSGGIDKIDILFMIDNSLSMGDKQAVLAAAVPQLLSRLTNPDCIDPEGAQPARQMQDPNTSCAAGLQREFAPVKDIHIGVVTSSLGDYGGDTCPEDGPQNIAQNDHAWLLGALPRTGGTLGTFLSWTSDDVLNYGTQIVAKKAEFGNFVTAATELGCGNEMVLEGWYRFLIDPKPPTDVTMKDSNANQRGPVDGTIVNLRQAFLRPDSLVAVFMMSDENDCSMRDNTFAWVAMTAGGGFRMWRGSAPCKDNPNDPCCYSCMLADTKFGVSQACLDKDPTCRQGDAGGKMATADDDVNMRCRAMKKRFGYDFLFPPSRYVNALTKLKLCPDQDYGDLDCDCKEANSKGIACHPGNPVDNPLYQNLNPKYTPSGPSRTSADAVFLAGVIGVPWQDVAVDPSDNATLELKLASQLNWDWFAPPVSADYATTQLGDPLMRESSKPRTDDTRPHPVTNQPIAGPDSARMANKINGHEWNTSDKDVQFACIFSLDVQLTAGKNATRNCNLTTECGADDGSDAYKVCSRRFDGCSCTLSTTDPKSPLDPTLTHSPLCQDTAGNYTSGTQYFAKGYPGLRELQVLRGFYESDGKDNAIVGSICPKDLTADKTSSGYGYNPAVKSLVDRLKSKLSGTCLPRALIPQEDGTVPCAIVEAIPPNAARDWCDCAANLRDPVPADSTLANAIEGTLQREGYCGGGNGQPNCSEFCFCRLKELVPTSSDPAIAAAGTRCLTETNVEKNTTPPGFCYVDPAQGKGVDAVVASCKPNEKRIIRIVGDERQSPPPRLSAPAPGRVFIACSGAAYGDPDCKDPNLVAANMGGLAKPDYDTGVGCAVGDQPCVVRDPNDKHVMNTCACVGSPTWRCPVAD
jgi:hypothetical protein